MTDEMTPEGPRPLKVITCINRRHPSRSCYLLIEDDRDVKLKHRQWHIDQETDREGLRTSIKNRDDEIAKLKAEIAGYRRDVRAMDETVQGFHGEVERVETPTIPPAIEINRAGYSDDELEDEPDEPDPWAGLDSTASATPDPDGDETTKWVDLDAVEAKATEDTRMRHSANDVVYSTGDPSRVGNPTEID